MKNLKKILKTQLRPVPNKFVITGIILAIIGFIDATYLAVEHIMGRIPPCSIIEGCDAVLSGPYAELFGIPVALLGAIYYFILLVGFLAYIESKNDKIMPTLTIFTVVGLVCSIWFVILQIFIIKSICLYCMGSAISSTLLFILAMVIRSKFKLEFMDNNEVTQLK